MKQYKCSLDDAMHFFSESIAKNEAVAALITNAASEKQLSKSALFKEFVKKHKKELYYRLRKYKSSDESKEALMEALEDAKSNANDVTRAALLKQLAAFHVSSQERFNENELFYQQVSGLIADATTLIDIGCGVQPLFFPKDKFPALTKYIALDKDRDSIAIMQQFKDVFAEQYEWLHPRVWNIGEGWDAVCAGFNITNFDAALILKVVPVVKRVGPALLDELAKVPADMVIISGVKESMVKKQDIERKERRAINGFINASGKTVTSEFELENEFFIIVN